MPTVSAKTSIKHIDAISGMSRPVGSRIVTVGGKTYDVPLAYIIDEHEYVLPAPPTKAIKIKSCYNKDIDHVIPLEELIINLDKDAENAFWDRQFVPKYFEQYIPGHTELFADATFYDDNGLLAALSDDDTREMLYYFDREMYRRDNGVWMVNKDKLEYLTEDHYFTLQWCKMYGIKDNNLPPWRPKGYKYGEFREFQRDVYYLVKKVRNDENILGLYVCKPKKTGITQVFACYYLNKSTKEAECQMGVMSKGNDAAAVNMLMYFHAFDGLPNIFKPVTQFRADIAGSIFFGEQSVKSWRTKGSLARLGQLQNTHPLDTKVYAAKTKAAGFDSPTMTDVWFDEFPKYDTENNQDPEMIWERNKETVKFQDYYNGRIWITSYPPEYDTRGFFQAKTIYYASKKETAKNNPYGRTATGLICITISALYSYFRAFDKYGHCDMIEADKRIEVERDGVKHDRQKLQAAIRQYCKSEREAWSSAGAGSTFNNLRLGEIHANLEVRIRQEGRDYLEGHYEWENVMWEEGAKDKRPKKTFGPVKFVALTEDQILRGDKDVCRYYEPLPRNQQNFLLRFGRDEFGNVMGPKKHEIVNVAGIDPTDYAAGHEVVKGSKNAMVGMNLPDVLLNSQLRRLASKIITSTYLYRHDVPHHFYEDVVKKIVFEGCVVLVESNKPWVATQLIEDGLGRWMIVKNKDENNRYELWKPYVVKKGKREPMNYGLVRALEDEVETIVRVISRYIQQVKEDEGEDYGNSIRDERVLDQLMNFTKENSKLFDLVMAFGWCLICMEAVLNLPVDETPPAYAEAMVSTVWSAIMDDQ